MQRKAPPKIRGRSRGRKLSEDLERNLQSKLRSPGAASAQEWVADTYVAGGGKSQVADTPSRRGVKAIACRVGDEVRQVRIGEIGVVENIKELSPELQNQAFRQIRVLEDGEVELLERGTPKAITTHVAEMAGSS